MVEQLPVPDFEQTVLAHFDAAYNLARWLTRDKADAEDIVQEACLRALRFFPSFRGGDGRAWLLKIVRNTCYTWLQANRKWREAEVFDEDHFPPDSRIPTPEQISLQNDTSELVRKALEKLPVKYREAIVLRELEGMSYKEIAEIAGMPVGTVMSTLSRARERLRCVLADVRSGGVQASSQRGSVRASGREPFPARAEDDADQGEGDEDRDRSPQPRGHLFAAALRKAVLAEHGG